MIDVSALPRVSLGERQSLPLISAVYFAINANGDVLYIGAAKSLRVRWQSHHRLNQLSRLGCVAIAWLPEDAPRTLERKLITRFNPDLNGSPRSDEVEPTVAFRVPLALREFYQSIASREGRTLSQVLRRALEDQRARAKRKAA